MKKIYAIGSIAFLIFSLSSCTDVPLSYDKTIPDNRLLGTYWECDDHLFKIERLDDNTGIYHEYSKDKATDLYNGGGTQKTIYFTKITDKEGTFTFASYREDANSYSSVRLRFNSGGELLVSFFDEDYLWKFFPKKDGKITIGSSENFKNFIQTKMRLADLYGDAKTYKKKKNLN